MSRPTIDTDRLRIRSLTLDDFEAIHRVMTEAFGAPDDADESLEERRRWLAWTVENEWALEMLYQPPYGERAIVLKASGALIGAVGLVPGCGPFETLPAFRARLHVAPPRQSTPEIGLFWALDAAHRGQGYATEAARALAMFAFSEWGLARIVATTEHDNAASIGVMRRLGMTIERNPHADPPWFQTVGVLWNEKA